MNRGRFGGDSSRRRILPGASLLMRSGPFQGPTGTFAVLLILAVAMVGFVEIGLAFPLTTGMTCVFLLCCGLLFLPFLLVNRTRAKWVLAGLFLVAVLGIHLIPWNTRKVFLRDLRDIRTGMTAVEVDRIMGRWLSRSESGEPPDRSDASLPAAAPGAALSRMPQSKAYRHSQASRFRSDLGVVRFTNGHVAAVEFLSD
jgi:hypothetical protein